MISEDATVALRQALGMIDGYKERKGAVWARDPDGKPIPIAFDKKTKQPFVCDNQRQGVKLVMEYICSLAISSLIDRDTKLFVPMPEDFMYVFTEDVDDEGDEIMVTSDAIDIISRAKGKK